MRTQNFVVICWLGMWMAAVDAFRLDGTAGGTRLQPIRESEYHYEPHVDDASISSFLDRLSSLSSSRSSLPPTSPSKYISRRAAAARGARVAFIAWWATTAAAAAQSASSTVPGNIVVLGGSGFVGSRVVEVLRSMGANVVSTSTDGRDGTIALDLTSTDATSVLKDIFSGVGAVVSCVGKIGTADDEAINAATGHAAMAAKTAGVDRFVYITVSPDVKEFASDIDFLAGYMRGKKYSRDAVLEMYGDKATLIEPTFIYGGGSFEVSPPRVPDFYGRVIEGLLSASPVRQLERVISPGIIKIALEPPVPVDDVARAAVAGALGKAPLSILDTYDKIKSASQVIH
jgi:hypothetical protein